ncbi:MAG: hypothetical protein KGL65_10470 [Rhodospirillales bacterium]|nr:hypothetical protein [Rhodospirillales bacterium]
MDTTNIQTSIRHLADNRGVVPGATLTGYLLRARDGDRLHGGETADIVITPDKGAVNITISGHFQIPSGVCVQFPGDLLLLDGGIFGEGSLNVQGSLSAKSVHVRELSVNGTVRLTGHAVADGHIHVGGSLITPTGSWVMVKSGSIRAGSLDIGNLVAPKVDVENRASIRGGLLSARNVTVKDKLHIGRGREGDVTGLCAETLEAMTVDSDASVIVTHAKVLTGDLFVMGDLIADTLTVGRPANIAVRGSLAVRQLYAEGQILAAFDRKFSNHGIPARISVQRETLPRIEFHGCEVSEFSQEFAAEICKRTLSPIHALIAEAMTDQFPTPTPQPIRKQAQLQEAIPDHSAEMSL